MSDDMKAVKPGKAEQSKQAKHPGSVRRRVRWSAGIMAIGVLAITLLTPNPGSILVAQPKAIAAEVVLANPDTRQELTQLAKQDPVAFMQACIDNYDRVVRDYQVIVTKQEMLPDGLSKEQELEVIFRNEPFAVVMNFRKNAGLAQKILYSVALSPKEILVKPIGLLGGLVRSVRREVNGPDALRYARKTIDQFGFRNALLMLHDTTQAAREESFLRSVRFVGMREVAGRQTFYFERRTNNSSGRFPDWACDFHIDAEWLVPTSVISRDQAGELLGRYLFTEVQFNIGLPPEQFTPEHHGM